MKQQLIWRPEYSVNVAEIDHQHKKLFDIINQLIEIVDSKPSKERLQAIIKQIVDYKEEHFAFEEKYFKEFNYSEAEKHIAEHNNFSKKIKELQELHKADVSAFTFSLLDLLEDWLVEHLLKMDQRYIKCFNEHGLF
jgi:hemerythrin